MTLILDTGYHSNFKALQGGADSPTFVLLNDLVPKTGWMIKVLLKVH